MYSLYTLVSVLENCRFSYEQKRNQTVGFVNCCACSNHISFSLFFLGAVSHSEWLQIKGKRPPLFCYYVLHYYILHFMVMLKHKFRSVFGDLLRRISIITLRKQLAKVLNWKVSKQPSVLSK